MKSTLRVVLAIACGLALTAKAQTAVTAPRHYVVAIAPGLSKEKGAEVLRQSFDLLLNRAQPGDCVEFYDAPQLTKLTSVTVPAGSARERANSREFAARFGVLKKCLTEPWAGDPRLAGQLRLPQLLDTVAKTRQPNQHTTLVLVGSPLFITTHPNEMAFNMESGLTPGDGMVTCSSSKSLFGTAERKDQLNGVAIHWLTPGDAWATSEMHRAAVLRFWTVFVGEQGATLATFGSDTGAVFDRAVRGEDRPLVSAKADANDHGLIMRPPPAFRREAAAAPPPPRVEVASKPAAETAKPESEVNPPPGPPAPPTTAPVVTAPATLPVAAPAPIPAPHLTNPVVAAPVQPAAPPPVPPVMAPAPPCVEETRPVLEPARKLAAPVAVPVPAELPTPAAGNIGIAAVWVGGRGADVDLHVSANPHAGLPEACWHRPRVERVRLFRDIRTSQSVRETARGQAVWEYAEIEGARLNKPSVWLNLYEANGPVSGIVRVEFEGHIADRPFNFNVARGNKGRDAGLEARKRSPYWLRIDLQDFEVPSRADRGRAGNGG